MSDRKHWLVRPENIRKLWFAFTGILVLTLLAEIVVHIEGHFGIDGWPTFFAAFGFLSCVAMIVFAKVLGVLLKRRDTYYDDN